MQTPHQDTPNLLRLEINFEKVLGRYQDQQFHWPQARFVLLADTETDKKNLGLQLSVRFLETEIETLIDTFAALAAFENGFLDYSFQMKASVFEAYREAFDQIKLPHQILEIDDFLCLDLQHYTCLGPAQFD